MNTMEQWFDDLPWALKMVFALPVLDGVFWGTYRIARGHLVVGLFWLIFGGFVLWPFDLVAILFFGRVRFLI